MRSELKKAREAEKKANDAKKEMVAKLSHDIKTPLTSIINYIDLMQKEHTQLYDIIYLCYILKAFL